MLALLVAGIAFSNHAAPHVPVLTAAARAQAPVALLAGALVGARWGRRCIHRRARVVAVWWMSFSLVTSWVAGFMAWRAPCISGRVVRNGVFVAQLERGDGPDGCVAVALSVRVLCGLAAAVQVCYLLSSLFYVVHQGLMERGVPATLGGVLTLTMKWRGPPRDQERAPRLWQSAVPAILAFNVAACTIVELRTALYVAVAPAVSRFALLGAFTVGLDVGGVRGAAPVTAAVAVASLVWAFADGTSPGAACDAAVASFADVEARVWCKESVIAGRVFLVGQVVVALGHVAGKVLATII
jgi:hypothetical protein